MDSRNKLCMRSEDQTVSLTQKAWALVPIRYTGTNCKSSWVVEESRNMQGTSEGLNNCKTWKSWILLFDGRM